jgi:spermidine/putrescine transport system permease protein
VTPRTERRLLLPGLLWLAVFAFAPLALVVCVSLAERGRPLVWTLDGGAWVRLADARWLAVLVRSLLLASATTAICLAVGAPLAWFLARRTERVRNVLHMLVLVPLWANTLALLCAWKAILLRDGVLDRALRACGLLGDDATNGLLHTPWAVLVGLVYAALPIMVQACRQSMERIDPRLLEAAEDLGATRWTAIRRVAIPLARPGMVAGSVLVFLPSLGAFVAPDLLGGAKTAHVGTLVRDCFYLDPTDWPLGAALGTALLAVTGLAAWAWFRHAERGVARA